MIQCSADQERKREKNKRKHESRAISLLIASYTERVLCLSYALKLLACYSIFELGATDVSTYRVFSRRDIDDMPWLILKSIAT